MTTKRLLKPGLALGLLFLLSPSARGADPKWFDTTDHLVVSEIQSDPLGNFFVVSLSGEEGRIYMSYNFDIILPHGVTFPITGCDEDGNDTGNIFLNNEDGLYPVIYQKPYGYLPTHTFAHSIKDIGNRAKVICFNTSNANFLNAYGSLCDCYVEIHPLAKPGENIVKFRDIVFVEKGLDGSSISWAPHNVLHNVLYTTINIPAERTVEVKIPADRKWGTLILPFALAELPEGVTAYKASAINSYNEVELEAATRLEAYKPYLINAPQGWSATLSGIALEEEFPSAATFTTRTYVESDGVLADDEYKDEHPAHVMATHGVLQANMRSHELADGYLLTVDGDTPTFTRVDASAPQTLSTGDVFIAAPADRELPATLPAKVTVDTASPIVAADVEPQPVYDLQGRRLTEPRDGEIYITAGRKYVRP